MTKKEFIKKIIEIEHPIMIFGSDPDKDLLNSWCFIQDEKNGANSFDVYYCRLSNKEYHQGNIEDYFKREKKIKDEI